jgi:hypothetical protein
VLDSCEAITKTVLHELGHLHGLADNARFTGPSVMNGYAGKNDAGAQLPMTPTRCDAQQALLAAVVVRDAGEFRLLLTPRRLRGRQRPAPALTARRCKPAATVRDAFGVPRCSR